MQTDTIKERLSVIPGVKLNDVEYAAKGFCLDIQATAETVVQVVDAINKSGFFIEAITGVDWLGENAARQKEAADRAKAAAEGEQQPSLPIIAPQELQVDDLEVVYDFNQYNIFCRITVRVRVPRNKAELPTISAIYPGADWHERETHDFFGIKFIGHPNLIPLLLPEDSDFHPLLKDFKA